MKRQDKYKRWFFLFLIAGLLLASCGTKIENNENDKKIEEQGFHTTTVKNEKAVKTIPLRGSVIPVKKVTIASEVQGKSIRTAKALKEGIVFNKGELILSIDNTESHYNLNSSKSKFVGSLNRVMSTVKLDYPDEYHLWENYLLTYNENKGLPNLPKIENQNLRNFLISNNIFELYYSIKSQESKLNKYKIYAPFNGVLTETYLQTGEMVIPQMKVAVLSGTNAFELETSVSLSELKFIQTGQQVDLYNQDLDKYFKGTITRINQKLDNKTQTIRTYILIRDKTLKEGMFLEGQISYALNEKAYAIPRKLIKRNNEVYVIRDSIVHAISVTPLFKQDNNIVACGLNDGDLMIDEVVNSPIIGTKAISKN